MHTKFIDQEIKYTGKELGPHWIYKNFNLCSDAIVGFIGECEVNLDEMVDVEDVIKNEPIYSEKMLHFIVEHFNISLVEGVLRQRLLICIIKEIIEKNATKDIVGEIIRKGDDLYFRNGKLSVSIATKSMTSVLIHVGINITSENTPVKTSGLKSELKLTKIKEIGQNIIESYAKESKDLIKAASKVRGVI